MGSTVFPAPSAGGKTEYKTTLTSGTSWTVPAGVTYVNVCLMGGGGSGGGDNSNSIDHSGYPGAVIFSTLATTPGASIAYSIGAGGSGASVNNYGNPGGTTTFAGATSAPGGNGGHPGSGNAANSATSASSANNGGFGGYFYPNNTSAGGAGKIDIEYWV